MPRSTRRSVLLALGGGAAGLAPRPAAAGRQWCRMDPLVAIDEALAEILVAVRFVDVLRVSGPTAIVVAVPPGVDARLLVPGAWSTKRGTLSGPGFRHGEYTRFRADRRLERTRKGIQLEIAVRVPSREPLPVRLEFAPRVVGLLDPAAAEGTTNAWVRLTTTF